MAQSTLSGPLDITNGLNASLVTANALGAGAVIGPKLGAGAATTRAVGTGADGPKLAFTLENVAGNLSAASGTIQVGWRFVAPNRTTFIREINAAFARGGSAPQGGNFRFKMWSNAVSKGLAGTSVAGATNAVVAIRGLTATLPARSLVGLAVHTVGGTVIGGGCKPTVYLTYR